MDTTNRRPPSPRLPAADERASIESRLPERWRAANPDRPAETRSRRRFDDIF